MAFAQTPPDWQALLERFLLEVKASKSTRSIYRYNISYFLEHLAARHIDRPTVSDFLDYKLALLDKGHKLATLNAYLIAVRRFFQWLSYREIYANITDGVGVAKIDRHIKTSDTLTAEQVATVLSLDLTPRDRAIIALMAVDGLRCIEVTRANVEDLRITDGATFLFVQGKGRTSKSDKVKVSPDVESLIRAYLATRGNVKEGAPLFASNAHRNTGERLTTRSISRIVKTALVAAGLNSSRLTAHSLRHTAVTLALKAGHSIQEVARFARHADLSTTLIYAHNLEDEQSTCSLDVSRVIFKKTISLDTIKHAPAAKRHGNARNTGINITTIRRANRRA